MDIIEKKLPFESVESKAFHKYFKDFKVGVLDIETTGLSYGKNNIVLVGLLIRENDHLILKQFFCDSLQEEKEVLLLVMDELEKLDIVITYNGISFDIPFIRERCILNQVPYVSNFYNLDLYILLRRFSPLREILPNLKQKTIENYMGLWEERRDEISGGESVDLYFSYLDTKDKEVKDKILLHNHDDVILLNKLIRVLGKVDLHKALSNLGFPFKYKDEMFKIQRIECKKEKIKVKGFQPRGRGFPIEAISFKDIDSPIEYSFSIRNEDFEISIDNINIQKENYLEINEIATGLLTLVLRELKI